MKRRKAKPVVPHLPGPAFPSFPGEADPFSAMEGLRSGNEHPVGYFVSDVAKVLSLLATLLDPKGGLERERRLQFFPRAHPKSAPVTTKRLTGEEDPEWEGTLDQVEKAIEIGSAEAVAWYLRDAAEVLTGLGTALDAPSGSRAWRLEFVRKGRGRRSDPNKFWADSAISSDVLHATWAAGKQEAAIAEVAQKRGVSRARIFRAKKKLSKKESHKKQ